MLICEHLIKFDLIYSTQVPFTMLMNAAAYADRTMNLHHRCSVRNAATQRQHPTFSNLELSFTFNSVVLSRFRNVLLSVIALLVLTCLENNIKVIMFGNKPCKLILCCLHFITCNLQSANYEAVLIESWIQNCVWHN